MLRPILFAAVILGTTMLRADEAADVMARMRENDAHFDGIMLKCKRTWDAVLQPRRPRNFGFGEEQPERTADYWKPVKYQGLAHEELIVKGTNRVISIDFDESMKKADKYRRIGAGFARTGDFGSVVYYYDNSQLPDDDPAKKMRNYERQLRIRPYKFELGAIYDTLLGRELGLGVGFGKRIESVTSCEALESGHRLKGTIKIWIEDVSDFDIEVDVDGVVRKATINCDVKGNRTRFVTTSQGTIKRGGFRIAKRGHFERHHIRNQANVLKKFDVELVSVITGIDDKQFEELSRFDLKPLMQYDDFVEDKHGTCLELDDGTIAVKLRNRKILRKATDHRGLAVAARDPAEG